MKRKFIAIAISVAAVAGLIFWNGLPGAEARTDLFALHVKDTLEVYIPADLAGEGTHIQAEILDADDKVISSQSSSAARGGAEFDLPLPAGLKREDLVWYRLRYGSQKNAPKIVRIGEILRYPVVRVFGQRELIAGSIGTLRVVAVDSVTGEALRADVEVELKTKEGKRLIASAKEATDKHGTIQPRLKLPQDIAEPGELHIKVQTPIGTEEVFEEVSLVKRESILLTTDKPIYQPGHLVHIRALVLDRMSRKSISDLVTFEIEDAKGNKVFKKRILSDAFGVSSTQFQLAEEVNMGTFKLRAIVGDPEKGTTSTQERSFVVDRYVLPKFKIDIRLQGGEDERQQKRYYSPGETVRGRVEAKYIFGKPVQRAKISIKMSTFDVERVQLESTEGFTDEAGTYSFALRLPNSFAGRSFEQGAAPVALEVEVTDTAHHTETRAESLLVSRNQILVTAVPESGSLVPKLINRVYVLTTYPDGSPAETQISGNLVPAVLKTGSDGIAVIEVNGSNNFLHLAAKDKAGRSGTADIRLETKATGDDSLLLRTNKPIYRVGESLEVTAISTKTAGSLYLDVIKDRQTILTQALELKDGKAKTVLDLTPDLFGTIEIRAYIFGRNAEPVSDRRIVFVDPADDLQIEATTSKESFRPGQEAELEISVRDRLGRPTQAIIDLQVVDEAVFALSERQPGFEKVFFYLEQELLKPRYEIHEIGFDDILCPTPEDKEQIARRERAAAVLMSAAAEVNAYTISGKYGPEKLDTRIGDYYSKYAKLTHTKLSKVVEGVNRYYAATGTTSGNLNTDIEQAVATGHLATSDTLDPWGRKYVFQGQIQNNYAQFQTLVKFADRADSDYYFWISGTRTQPPASSLDKKPFKGSVKIEEAVAPDTGYAQITGSVTGASRPLARAHVRVRRQEDGKVFRTVTSEQGEFIYSALKPGSYELTVEAEGHHGTVYSWIVVKARDRAVLSVPLERASTGAVIQLVLNKYYDQHMERRRNGRHMRGGGIADMEVDMLAVNSAPVARELKKQAAREEQLASKDKSADEAPRESSGGEERTKVRSYFPETLYVNPALITDASGRARVKIPMADSITTWRVSMLGSTKRGLLGSATTGIKVFQDFFIDIDLPVSLTQNDTVQIPVAVYNYLSDAQDVEVTLKQEDWFQLVDDTAVKTVRVGAEEVTSVSYRIRASRIGLQVMTVSARLTSRNSVANGDAIARSIEIRPDGEQREAVVNDRLVDGSTIKEIEIPENAVADASKVLVKFYPGPLSQVVEGLDSILRMPSGCFEQTSSANYPNVLVLDYMKTTKRITPEIQAKAEGFVSLGYQKLVTFEVAGGGFSWFGDAPANKILTGFGLMQFYDMSRVHEVDPRLIRRTQDWLAGQQKPDGSWEPDSRFIDEGATNNYHDNRLRIAAYLGWVLAYSGYSGDTVSKAKQYVEKTMTGKEDPYTLAVIANFAADFNRDKAWIERASNALIAKVTEQERSAFWKMENASTPMYAHGQMADIETTALAAQALIKAGRSPQLATKALQFLTEKKDAYGNWHSTQATILSLKAFLLSQTRGVSADTEGTITVKLNGKDAATVKINKDNNDLLHQIDLKTSAGRNRVELEFSGKGSLLYQIVGRYFTPWAKKMERQEPLSIDLKYDRTRLEQDDIATATVTVHNQMRQRAKMVMIDLGVPPGFEVLAEDLQEAVSLNAAEKFGNLTKFTVTPRQIVLYLDGLKAGQSFSLKYRLKAKYPLKAKTPESRVYQYYNPEIGSRLQPVELSVIEKKR